MRKAYYKVLNINRVAYTSLIYPKPERFYMEGNIPIFVLCFLPKLWVLYGSYVVAVSTHGLLNNFQRYISQGIQIASFLAYVSA